MNITHLVLFKFFTGASSAVVDVAVRSQVNYLGRYWLGDAIPLLVHSRNNAQTPTDAASWPIERWTGLFILSVG